MDVCVREWGLVCVWVCSCTCMHVHVWVHTCGKQARDEEGKATVARVHGVAMLCYNTLHLTLTDLKYWVILQESLK